MAPTAVSRPAGGWPFRRWAALVALLLAEGLWIAVRFDTQSVASLRRGWWTPILDLAGSVMPAILALFVAVVLVVWSRAREWFAEAPAAPDPPRRYLPYLAAHVLCFGALFTATRALFRPDLARPGGLVALWLSAIVLTVVTWLGAMQSPRVWIAWVRARAWMLLASLALGLIAYGIGHLAQGLWAPLRRVTFAAADAMLGAITSRSYPEPEKLIFGTDVFAVEIAPQCSGYEGVGLTCAFMLAALWLFRDRFRMPRALLLMLPAIVLPWIANVVRLVLLVLVGTYVSPRLAQGGFHSYAGSILFCAVALAIVATGLRTPWLTRVAETRQTQAGPSVAPYLVPFIAMTAAGLLSRSLSTASQEPLYALRPIAGLVALACYWRSYRAIPWRFEWLATALGLGVGGLWLGLERVLPHEVPAAVATAGAAWLATRAATAILLVPAVEELAFRGFLARRIASANIDQVDATRLPWHAIALSALAFGLLHHRPVPATIAGLSYAWIYRRRGSLWDAVIAHATTNAVLVLAAAMTGAWDLWR